MTGFFARMAERAVGREVALQPRLPARFEASSLEPAELHVEEVERLAPTVVAGVEEEPAVERASVPPAARAPDSPAPVQPRAAPAEPRAPALEPAPRPERGGEPPPPAGTAPEPPPVRQPAPAEPAEPAPEREDRPRPEVAERPPPSLELAQPPAAPRRRRRPAPGPVATPALDLAALLRDHVVPALVERGAVSRDERPVVAAPSGAAAVRGRGAPRPGTIGVRATPAVVAAPARAEPGEPRERDADPAVHLHIDRVVVTRAPAPAPPQPAPPPRPPRRTVDHAAYLARRRERP